MRKISVGVADDIFAVLPKALEIVKVAHFVVENVDDYVGIVDDRPTAFAEAFVTAGNFAVFLLQFFL